MTGTGPAARTPSAQPPRHGRRVRRGRVRARRFGPAVLALAAVLGGVGGAATGAVIDRPAAAGQASSTTQPDPTVEPQPQTESPAQPEAFGEGRTTSSLGAGSTLGAGTPVVPDVPGPLRTPTPLEPVPDPDAVDEDGLTAADRGAGLLSTEVPASASGELTVVPGSQPAPERDGDEKTVRVEVEDGLDIDGELFARTVMDTLNDPRGWGGDGSVGFARTDGDADLRVVLASPTTVDEMCAPLRTQSLYSCGRYGHAALNHTRWVAGTDEFDDLTVYRQYLVNHEVGHLLGHPHEDCPGDGELAPLMQQQTVTVAPCEPNSWPFPEES